MRKIPLMERTGHLPIRPALVQRGGFSDEVKLLAKKEGGVLLDLAALTALFDTYAV